MSEKEKNSAKKMKEILSQLPEQKRERILGYGEGILAAQQLNENKKED